MSTLVQIVIYPLQRLAVLLFSMQIADGISIGALMVAACLLMVIFKALVGIHLSVFSNRRGETEDEAVERGIRNRRIRERVNREYKG